MSQQSIKSVHLLSKTRIIYGTPLTVEPKPGAKARQLTAAAIALATAAALDRQANEQAINGYNIPEPRLGVPILFPSLTFPEKGGLCYSI